MSLKPRTVDFDQIWSGLQYTVEQVVTITSVKRSTWIERYSDVYSLCVAAPEPQADRLYYETKKVIETHVQMLHDKVSAQKDSLLTVYHSHWLEFSEGMGYLNSLFSYLNSQHIQKQKMYDADLQYGTLSVEPPEQMMEIGELGLEIWQRVMVAPLEESLVSTILQEILQDRSQASTDVSTSIIKGVIHSFVDVNMLKRPTFQEGLDSLRNTANESLKLYEKSIEEPLLRETGEFYRNEASALLQTCTVSQYMERVSHRLREEELRATKFLPPSSHQKVVREVQDRMVGDHLSTIQAECQRMVSSEAMQDLCHMYRLCKTIKGALATLVTHIEQHIKEKGLQAVSNLKGDAIQQQFVENLLSVHRKYRAMIMDVFECDQLLIGALDRAFESVVNHRSNAKHNCRSPEVLAKYCDMLLKKSSKGLNESEVDDRLGQSITLFKYIDDKDVFQKFYARSLAKRLIHQQSQSMDSEEAMINKLKLTCGYEYTSKLHRMFTDMSVSSDLSQKFAHFMENEDIELGINFSVYVLQAGAWPLGQTLMTPFDVPHELLKAVQMFEIFYHKNFNGRKLQWIHHLCQGELKVNFSKRTYLINMSTYQMAMLLMFEKVDVVSYKELQTHTALNDEQFNKFLLSLIESKILICDEEELSSDSNIRLNISYTNKRTKFKITVASAREIQTETESTHAAVEEDRKLYLQAAVVRIMKARKVLKHNLLMQEVISQSRTRFTPQIPMIKKCIEILIDKQYLERTANSADEYSYVA